MSERNESRESREARAERRSARSRLGFDVSDFRENHSFRPLSFKPGISVFTDIVARSAQDLITSRIDVSPGFIEMQWGRGEADKYRRGHLSNGNETKDDK